MKIKRRQHLFLVMIFFLTASCGENTLQSLNEQKSTLNQNTKAGTYYGIYSQPNDLTLPPFKVVDFEKLESSGTLPNNLIKNEYGDRTNSTTPQPLNYFIRNIKLNSQFDNGDFFFEAPILSEKYELNAGATALTQILKYSFNQPISLSRVRWEEILLQTELGVSKIDSLTTSEIIEKILANSKLLSSIHALVLTQNPGVTIKKFNPPEMILAWSNPPLEPNEKSKAVKQIANETSEAFLWLIFWNPQDSTNRILPDSWSHLKNDNSTTNLGPQETYIYRFDYNSQGNHVISALKTINNVTTQFDFPFEVLNDNLLPKWATGLQLTFIENHPNEINLEQVSAGLPGANDPEGAVLIYSLVQDTSIPSGMVVKLVNNVHYLTWTPDAKDPDLVRSGTVKLIAQDSDGGSAAVAIPFTVIKDTLPTIISMPSSWSLTEGLEGNIIIETKDSDADPVIPQCRLKTNPAFLVRGSPLGAGAFTFTEEPGSIPGHQIFKAKLTPSYLETIGQNKTLTIQCTVNYNGNGLVDIGKNDPHEIEASIINADDPPIWIAGASFPNPSVTENTPFSGLAIGSVSDPNPHPSVMTYKVINASLTGGCDWDADHGGAMAITETIVGDHSELNLSGTPVYISAAECSYVIEATDINGLTSRSEAFSLTTIDTNRAPTIASNPAPETNYTVDEGKSLQFVVSTFFIDSDAVDSDPRELLTYSCNECNSISELKFESTSGSFSWIPSANRADSSPYTFTINVTDKAGTTASLPITITVIDVPAPANLTLSETYVVVNEMSGAHGIDLTIRAASALPVDAFAYTLTAQGTCRPGLIENPSGTTSGTTSAAGEIISFSLNPSKTTDGNSPLPGLSKSCLMTFTVTKTDDPTVTSSINLSIKVVNVNRTPNTVIVAGDSNTTTYNLNLTAGPSDYISGIWIKTHKVNLGVNDSDVTEDPIVDSFSYTSTLGSIASNGQWSFKLPSCLRYESGKISTLNATVTVDDGRQGTRSRVVKITVTNARSLGCN